MIGIHFFVIQSFKERFYHKFSQYYQPISKNLLTAKLSRQCTENINILVSTVGHSDTYFCQLAKSFYAFIQNILLDDTSIAFDSQLKSFILNGS
jgi:hypothetical protein